MNPRASRARLVVSALASLLVLSCSACSNTVSGPASEAAREARDGRDEAARIEGLRAYERELRARVSAGAVPSSETSLGADPWAIRPVVHAASNERARYVGILRGRSAIVLLDEALHELTRAPAPRSTTGLAVLDDGTIAASGELAGDVALFAIEHDVIVPRGQIALGAEGVRDLAAGPEGALAALDARNARVYWLPPAALKRKVGPFASFPTCIGGAQLTRTKGALLTTCVVEHVIDVVPLNAVTHEPEPHRHAVLANDGPFFAIAANEERGVVTVAAGGVEDHPLDRREGSFGFIDSFVHVFEVTLATAASVRVSSINVSERGIVTPKAIALEQGEVRVAGYGTSDVVTLSLAKGHELARVAMPPGARSMAHSTGKTVVANPLLDAWVMLDANGTHVVPIEPASTRPFGSRLGEALVFTTLIAPWNKSEGRLSRFTCETCHFEGTVDGRVHHTGRGDVRATTKPILGLLDNAPHFSRALDPDLSVLSMNEFRAANAKSDHDPLFTLAASDAPWLLHLGARPDATQSPEDLRRAFIQFFTEFSHRPNVRALASMRTRDRGFSTEERRGAEVFRDRCESCHAAKLAANATERVPFAEWERLVLSPEAPLVFGDARYEKTGIEPTVHERGARVPSLRRIFLKRPYFTNGSAADIDAALDAVRFEGASFFHGRAPASAAPLPKPDRAALKTFLELL